MFFQKQKSSVCRGVDIFESANLHLCHHPEDVCWSQSPDSDGGRVKGRFLRTVSANSTQTKQPHLQSVSPYLQLLRLSSYFQQLCDGVHEPLEVMVTHLLDLPVMVPDPCVQLLHEESMLLTIVHRPG